MSLSGNLSDFSVLETLQLIGLQRKSGTLEITSGTQRRELHFVDGSLIGCQATRATDPEPFLESLVGLGQLEAAEARKLRNTAAEKGRELWDVLVEGTKLSPQTLQLTFRWVLQGAVDRILLWDRGRFVFHPGVPPLRPREVWSVDQVLMESMKRLDEAADLKAGEYGLETVPAPVEGPEPPQPPRASKDSQERVSEVLERAFLRKIDSQLTLAELAERMGLGEWDILTTARSLRSRGLVHLLTDQKKKPEQEQVLLQRPRLRNPAWLALILVLATGCAGLGLGVHRLSRDWVRPQTDAALRQRASFDREQAIRQALEIHRLRSGRYPENLADLVGSRIWPAEQTSDLEGMAYHPKAAGVAYVLELEPRP